MVVLQRALKVTPDGGFGAKTQAALVTFQTKQHLARNGIANRSVWNRLESRDYPLIAYRGLTLKQGSRGAAVVVMQRALRLTADGVFGPRTVASVTTVQSCQAGADRCGQRLDLGRDRESDASLARFSLSGRAVA